jgi:hypothetical protein
MSSINAVPDPQVGLLETKADGTATLALQTNGANAVVIDSSQNANMVSTGQFGVPVGTAAQRPTPTNGMFRYNTSNSSFEAYINSAWVNYGPVIVDALIVAGGGGGGGGIGGGGGAGAVISLPKLNLTPSTTYIFVVGAGGAAGSGYTQTPNGSSGSATTAFGATAAGGGGGISGYNVSGLSGGCGGGAGFVTGSPSPLPVGGAATGSSLGSNTGIIYGNAGGDQYAIRPATPCRGTGGGGAGSQAPNTDTTSVNSTTSVYGFGSGGAGISTDITGSTLYFGGGGGGGAFYENGYAGNGGIGGGGGGAGNAGGALGGGSSINSGGNGGTGDNATGGSGGTNSGGGGGAGSWSASSGGSGGSGVVILSIPTARYSGTYTGASVTVTTSGSNTVLRFNASGSYTA